MSRMSRRSHGCTDRCRSGSRRRIPELRRTPPNGADWYRWLIYNDKTSAVVGVVRLDSSAESLNLPETKVLLRSRAMDLLREAA